jgi:hypothetical protein
MPVIEKFNKSAQVLFAFGESARQAVGKACFDTEAEAKLRITSNGSVVTGAARASIYSDVDGKSNYAERASEAKEKNKEVKLLSAVHVRKSKGSSMGIVSVGVEYGADLEEGTNPHEIRPKNKKALYWKGASHPVKAVHHPGTPPKPYMLPAAEKAGAEFDKFCEQELKAQIR